MPAIRDGCAPTWAARMPTCPSKRAPTPRSGWRCFPTTDRPAATSTNESRSIGEGHFPMDYVRLGRTGLKVSRLCLGTMNFGPETSEKDSFAIMDRALELGFNFFDSANVYGWKQGEGVTEQIVGRWLAQGDGRGGKLVGAT